MSDAHNLEDDVERSNRCRPRMEMCPWFWSYTDKHRPWRWSIQMESMHKHKTEPSGTRTGYLADLIWFRRAVCWPRRVCVGRGLTAPKMWPGAPCSLLVAARRSRSAGVGVRGRALSCELSVYLAVCVSVLPAVCISIYVFILWTALNPRLSLRRAAECHSCQSTRRREKLRLCDHSRPLQGYHRTHPLDLQLVHFAIKPAHCNSTADTPQTTSKPSNKLTP